jgi:hypothetical protein
MALLLKLITRLTLIGLFIGIVVLIVALARGYRFNIDEKTITSTGIISANSSPEAAKIFVNGEFKGVTNQNITLSPGEYDVKITKEGFTDWQNKLKVLGEIVVSIDAVIFPKNPSLSPLTNLGIAKALPVGESDKVLIFVDNDNTERDGIYILEGTTRRLSLLSPLKKIVLKSLLPENVNFASSEVKFAQDYSEGIFTFPTEDKTATYSYLLSLEGDNTAPFDVSNSQNTILTAWEVNKQRDVTKILETFPRPIKTIATDSFRIISFSPDETKILYQAKEAVELPIAIKPRLIGVNQTVEKRTLEVGKVYIYDRKEDKNYLIPVENDKIQQPEFTPTPSIMPDELPVPTDSEATKTANIDILNYNRTEIFDYIQWYPSSRHLVLNEGKNIAVIQYDGTNKQSVYAGPYEPKFFGLNSEWKLLILANLNPGNNRFGDIYEVGIR